MGRDVVLLSYATEPLKPVEARALKRRWVVFILKGFMAANEIGRDGNREVRVCLVVI
jgi:hypothetical protein